MGGGTIPLGGGAIDTATRHHIYTYIYIACSVYNIWYGISGIWHMVYMMYKDKDPANRGFGNLHCLGP